MAPEQALGKTQEIDGRTDLFALGAMMFRIIAGRRVHESDNDSELLVAMASKPAPPLASVAPGTPVGVCAVVDLALGFSREARYPDAEVMLEDVRALLDDRPPAFAQRRITSSEQSTVMGAKAGTASPADGGVARAPTIAAAPEVDAPEPASESGDDDAAEALIGQVLADRYRVEALLGSGGMGSVYRAEHVHMRKDVAIKVLHREMTYLPEVVARFEREAVAAARIEHPNVAGAKDFGRLEDGSFYLVLEYVEGRSLRRVLDEGGAIDPARALHIARQVTSALAAAHAAGIVHRDLKPDNVMLVPRAGEQDAVKVLDFGIAKLSAEDTRDQPALTRVGSVFGTPEYMSPEQAVGQSVDARSDLYTVGILLYEMLEGRTPFAGDGGMVGVLTRQMTAEPPPLSPGVDPELARLVMTQLAKSPDQRIQTGDELVASLRQLEGNVTPSPPAAMAETGLSSLALGDTMLGGPLSVGAQPAVSVPGGLMPAAGNRALAGASRNLLATLRRSVEVGGQPIPVWALAATALLLLVVGVFVVGGVAIAAGGGSSGPSVLERAKEKLVRDPELDKEIKQAQGGDRAAIAKLEAKPASHRSAPVWRALGMGHTRAGDLAAAVRCYERALDLDSGLKKDPVVLEDLRKAAGPLGPAGVDIIYDVATSSKVRKPLSQHAKELLDRESVRAKASPALKIALELRKTKKCSELKELLPRVQKEGDRRSLAKLKHLKSHRGCGFLGLGDCYSCLRRGSELSDAIDAVDARPGPFGD
jgi:serine/threonine-protein kinase